MMMEARRLAFAVATILIAAYVGFAVSTKEKIRQEGRVVYLPLAPLDPRSLMQGDYMILRYPFSRNRDDLPRRGVFVLTLDSRGVGQIVRTQRSGEGLAAGEVCVRFFMHDNGPRIGAESFFFQEGHGTKFAQARFAALRVSKDCDKLLTGLLDANLKPINP